MTKLTQKQKEIGLLLLSSLFCLSVVAYAYFTFFAPKKESFVVAQTTIANDRQVLFALEQQIADQPEIPIVSSLELQKKVPVKPLSDLVLLQIEKAEVVSQSLVQSVNFTEGAFVIEAPPEGVETLQELLVSLSIETLTYSTLESFIEEIEKLDRILVVDSIQFSSNGEVTTAEQEQEKLQLTLTFSAFYRPDLLGLVDEGPKVDTPAPADKVNPLPSNSNIDDGEADSSETETVDIEDSENETTENNETQEAEDESDTVTQVPNRKPVTKIATAQSTNVVAKTQPKQKYQTYKVKPGDTLYSISMQHYGTRSGEAKIKVANDLPSNKVMVNETLIIPY